MKDDKIRQEDANPQISVLQAEIRSSEASKYSHRLHAVLLVQQGISCREVSRLFGDAPRTVAYWVDRFISDGVEGLLDRKRQGRPNLLSEAQLAEIAAALRMPPGTVKIDATHWDGRILVAFIEQRFGVEVSLRQAQRLLNRFGFHLRSLRPANSRLNNASSRAMALRRLYEME